MQACELRTLCRRHARTAQVREVDTVEPHWRVQDDTLLNIQADFFRVRGVEVAGAGPRIMLDQPHGALCMMLVVATPGQGRQLILSLRNEPGLIGGTNLSCTIQSTPANYRREHGGAATPFIKLSQTPHAHGRVVWDSIQYDWGGHYLGKTKRFLILETPGPVELPDNLLAVDATLARSLMLADDLTTNDLRVCLAAYVALEELGHAPAQTAPPAAAGERPKFDAVPLEQFRTHREGAVFEDAAGVGVGYFETQSPSREVPVWRQPLLTVAAPLNLYMPVSSARGVRRYAVAMKSQPGLLGARLWFPAASAAPVGPGAVQVATCAEGGRFYRHRIKLALGDATAAPTPRQAEQMTLAQLSATCLSSCATSLELRLLWSLACADA